jgi:molybdopterin-binding protein
VKISARNVLKGKVKKLVKGPVSTEVVIDLLGGGTITSVITRESADRLELEEGKEVCAIIKSTSVMIAVD